LWCPHTRGAETRSAQRRLPPLGTARLVDHPRGAHLRHGRWAEASSAGNAPFVYLLHSGVIIYFREKYSPPRRIAEWQRPYRPAPRRNGGTTSDSIKARP
jgi:hypothetical protein